MNREIKFRVWTGALMEYRIVAGKLGVFFVGGLDPEDSASMSPANTIYSGSVPVMQFTGLKDKKGQEIYEGDILQDNEYPEEGISNAAVTWNNDLGCWDTYPWGVTADFFEDYEVIGNIYENPELLKNGK